MTRRQQQVRLGSMALAIAGSVNTAWAQNLAYQDFTNPTYDATGRGYVNTFETAGDLTEFTSSNGTATWHAPSGGNSGYVTIPNGSHLTSNAWANWIDPNFMLNGTSDYTVEYRVKVSNTSNQGVASYDVPAVTSTAIGGVSFLNAGSDLKVFYGATTASATGTPRATLKSTVPWSPDTYEYHTVRMVAEYEPFVAGRYLYTLFLDGRRAGTNMTRSQSVAGLDRLIFGDIGTNHVGQMDLDYVAFRVGEAVAPTITFHPSLKPLTHHESKTNNRYKFGAADDLIMVRHVGASSNLYRSANNGTTWSLTGAIDPFNTNPGFPYESYVYQLGSSDDMVIVYTERNASYIRDGWNNTTNQATADGQTLIWSMRSTNGGVTWDSKQPLNTGYGNNRGALVTKSGKIVVPVSVMDQATDRASVHVRRSTNAGASYTTQGVTASALPLDIGSGKGREDGASEPTITQLANDDLLIMTRSSLGHLYQSRSTDDGATWSQLAATSIAASDSGATLLTLKNGMTLLQYNTLKPEFEDDYDEWTRDNPLAGVEYAAVDSSLFREEVSLAYSLDNALTWSDPIVIASLPALEPDYPNGQLKLSNFYMFERYDNVAWIKLGGATQWWEIDFNGFTVPPTSSTWIAPGSGNWGDAGNWTPAVVPDGSGHEVIFAGAIAANSTVSTAGNVTVGTMRFNHPTASYEIGGAGTVTLQSPGAATALLSVEAGAHAISAAVNVASNTRVDTAGGTSITVNGSLGMAAGKRITKVGGGTLSIDGPMTNGANSSLAVDVGTVNLATDLGAGLATPTERPDLFVSTAGGGPGAAVNMAASQSLNQLGVNPDGTATLAAGGDKMLVTRSLTVDGTAGRLNMNDNDFIVDYTGPSPELTLRDHVKAIYQGGTSGIAYTVGAGDTAIAVAERTEWGFSEFNGVALDTTAIVGKYTYFGDANLDGKVTSDDYVAVDVGLGTGDSWVQGDFNFSGTVTSDDYVAIDVNLGKGSPTPLAFAELKADMIALHTEMFGDAYVQMLARVEAEGFAALVPEPGSLSLLGLGAAGLLGRGAARVSRLRRLLW